ncbi:MAG: leucyl aminopeptidase family protein [Actinomycetota bacterium]|nr:MAG: leucyl aminopeptidase family protein [Actinomycetota bacterium]
MPEAAFSPVPSIAVSTEVSVAADVPTGATALGLLLSPSGDVPPRVGLDRARLEALGFDGSLGSTLVVPSADAPIVVVSGIGDAPDASALRDAAAAFAHATGKLDQLAVQLPAVDGVADEVAAEAVVEGVVLSRYSYDALRKKAAGTPVAALTLVADGGRSSAAEAGASRGRVLAGATAMSRDLANTPHNYLSAAKFADLAVELGPERGLEVEIFGKDQLREMRMGGILGINAGSVEPPRMIQLTYRPAGSPTARLALVGKGVMYDSGGLSLKPSDQWHAQMKNDMSGAAAVFATMCALKELGCTAEVVGYLMCTDNMPSGTATALGDVLTMRNGKTVEVMDTDAEGRLVIADALVLAAEAKPDAIFDIATLTGSAARALGSEMAAVMGNDQALVEQVKAAAAISGELVWQFPMHRPYRRMLDSLTADMTNCAPVGLPDAILSALFLSEFVGDSPWAHIDIAGPSQADARRSVLVPGCSGFGARLLAHAVCAFTPTAR